jgi:type IV fimbrial biogenesis protein FimT
MANIKEKITFHNGFTLIELLVTIAIAAIVAVVGIPGFTSTITSNRLATGANELIASINLARSEAIKRGVQVTILRLGATPTQWKDGWNIFVDLNANQAFNDDGDTSLCETDANGLLIEDCLLRTYPAIFSGYTLTTGGSTYQNFIAYTSTGLSTVTVGDTFRFCDSSADNTISRAITINAIGRARVSTGTASCP